jgi:hypothetical protein
MAARSPTRPGRPRRRIVHRDLKPGNTDRAERPGQSARPVQGRRPGRRCRRVAVAEDEHRYHERADTRHGGA